MFSDIQKQIDKIDKIDYEYNCNAGKWGLLIDNKFLSGGTVEDGIDGVDVECLLLNQFKMFILMDKIIELKKELNNRGVNVLNYDLV